MHEEFIRDDFISILGHLTEELNEVGQAVGKTIRFGPQSTNPLKPENKETNIEWILREIEDLELVIERLRKYNRDDLVRRQRRSVNEAALAVIKAHDIISNETQGIHPTYAEAYPRLAEIQKENSTKEEILRRDNVKVHPRVLAARAAGMKV